jgi:hypothetical protein
MIRKTYPTNNRRAKNILEIIKNRCAKGSHPFAKDLIAAVKAVTYPP